MYVCSKFNDSNDLRFGSKPNREEKIQKLDKFGLNYTGLTEDQL